MPRARAVSSPLASALLLITAAMRQGKSAASSASMLLPRPEMRMTMDFMSPPPGRPKEATSQHPGGRVSG